MTAEMNCFRIMEWTLIFSFVELRLYKAITERGSRRTTFFRHNESSRSVCPSVGRSVGSSVMLSFTLLLLDLLINVCCVCGLVLLFDFSASWESFRVGWVSLGASWDGLNAI